MGHEDRSDRTPPLVEPKDDEGVGDAGERRAPGAGRPVRTLEDAQELAALTGHKLVRVNASRATALSVGLWPDDEGIAVAIVMRGDERTIIASIDPEEAIRFAGRIVDVAREAARLSPHAEGFDA